MAGMRESSATLRHPILSLLLLAGASTPLGAQVLIPEPTPAPGAQAAPAQRTRTRIVAAAVGDELIKSGDLFGQVQMEMAQGRIRDLDQAEERMDELLQEMITRKLKVQAGQDMGFEATLIENFVDQLLSNQTERFGGTVAASRFLQESRIDPSDWRAVTRNEVYAAQWEQAVLGRGPGATGRPTVDRYIRPGELHAYYQSLLVSRDPADRAQLGEQPERVVLQELILPLADGDPELVVDRARLLIEAHEGGEDFTQLVRLHGAGKESDGIRRPQAVEALREFGNNRHGNQQLHQFALGAAPGDVSPPLLGATPRGQRAVWVYRLVERLDPTGPQAFLDQDLQDRLRDLLQGRIDDYRERVALQDVAGSAYVWPRDSWTAGTPVDVLREVDF